MSNRTHIGMPCRAILKVRQKTATCVLSDPSFVKGRISDLQEALTDKSPWPRHTHQPIQTTASRGAAKAEKEDRTRSADNRVVMSTKRSSQWGGAGGHAEMSSQPLSSSLVSPPMTPHLIPGHILNFNDFHITPRVRGGGRATLSPREREGGGVTLSPGERGVKGDDDLLDHSVSAVSAHSCTQCTQLSETGVGLVLSPGEREGGVTRSPSCTQCSQSSAGAGDMTPAHRAEEKAADGCVRGGAFILTQQPLILTQQPQAGDMTPASRAAEGEADGCARASLEPGRGGVGAECADTHAHRCKPCSDTNAQRYEAGDRGGTRRTQLHEACSDTHLQRNEAHGDRGGARGTQLNEALDASLDRYEACSDTHAHRSEARDRGGTRFTQLNEALDTSLFPSVCSRLFFQKKIVPHAHYTHKYTRARSIGSWKKWPAD
jgi:hypothetical protein